MVVFWLTSFPNQGIKNDEQGRIFQISYHKKISNRPLWLFSFVDLDSWNISQESYPRILINEIFGWTKLQMSHFLNWNDSKFEFFILYFFDILWHKLNSRKSEKFIRRLTTHHLILLTRTRCLPIRRKNHW